MRCGTPSTRHLVGDPIDVVTGANKDRALDFTLDGPIPVRFYRFSDSRWHRDDRGLGRGHRHGFEHWLAFDLDGVVYREPDGTDHRFLHFTHDGQRQAGGGYWLERLDEERFELRRRGKPTLIFRRPRGALDAELSEWIEQVDGREERIRFLYTQGRLDKILAPRDETLKLEWDTDGHIHGVQHWGSDGSSRTWLIRYHYEGACLTAGTDAYENTFHLAYDSAGRVARRTDRRGYSFHFEYDPAGRCVSSVGDDGVMSVQLTYEPLEYETRVMDGNGAEWIYQYTPTGVVTLITDPYGGVEYFKLGEDGRLLESYDAKGSKTRYLHDEAGAPIARVDPDGRHVPLPEPDVLPPRHGYRVPTRPIEYELGDRWERGFRLPDPHELPFELPAEVREVLTTSEHPLRGGVETVRDKQGLRLEVRLEDGRARTYGYNENGGIRRVTDLDGGTWKIEHASWNHVVAEIDPNDHRTTYEWSATEALSAVIDAAGTRTEYVRDLRDRVTQIWRNGIIRERYVRDAAGHIVEKRDTTGELLLEIDRDQAGRVLRRKLASGDEHTLRYDERGHLTEANTTHHKCSFEHDWAGRRIADERDGKGVRHRYAGELLVQTTVLDRFRTQYHSFPGGSTVVVDPAGATHRLRSHGRGIFTRDLANGLSETTQHEPRGGRVLAKVLYSKDGPSHAWARRFQYSGEGDLQLVVDSEGGPTRHEHDGAHRLIKTTHPDGREDGYEYNAAGSVFRSPTLGQATVGKGNQLRYANGERYEYDHRNHLSKRHGPRGTISYDYDSQDKLSVIFWEGPNGQTWGWDADYDPLGRRIRKAPGYKNDTHYYWDTDRLAAEVFHDGRVRVYVYADGFAMVPMLFIDYASADAEPGSGTRSYVVADQRGCVERVLDDQGNIVWKASIDPYGSAHIEVGHEFHQPLRFPGHWHDAETGLHYNRFRYYDPALCRYLQSDPWGLKGGFNLYAYTADPLVSVDVRGLGCGDSTGPDESDEQPQHPPDAEEPATPDNPWNRFQREHAGESRSRAEVAAAYHTERRNGEIRQWYNDQVARIPELDAHWRAEGLSTEERARRAYDVRHEARVGAREMMPDRSQVAALRQRDTQKYGNPDGPTFDQLVETNVERGMTHDEANESIIGSSTRTDDGYNRRFDATRSRQHE